MNFKGKLIMVWNKNANLIELNLLRYCLIILLVVFYKVEYSIAQASFKDVIKNEQSIPLEDSYGGGSSITTDNEGNFIVTNVKSKKISVYDSRGNLLLRYGREGRGPGDFLHPITTVKLFSGQFLTGELTGKLTLVNTKGDSVLKVYNTEILPLSEIHQINDSKILLVGRKRFVEQIKLLHIFDLSKGNIIKSFFELPFSIQDYGGVFGSLSSLPTADVRDGKIAAAIAPFKNLSIFNFDGELLRSFKFSLNYFKNIKEVTKRLVPRELDKYIITFSMIEKIFWLNNNTFLISYFHFTNFKFPDIMERQNSLAHINMDGSALFEVSGNPMIKAVHYPYVYMENSNLIDNVALIEGTFHF